jgi:hypothetical protein
MSRKTDSLLWGRDVCPLGVTIELAPDHSIDYHQPVIATRTVFDLVGCEIWMDGMDFHAKLPNSSNGEDKGIIFREGSIFRIICRSSGKVLWPIA